MVVLDIAIVNVALPSIKVDLGFSQENLQWVISAYALVFGGFLLLGGRAADLLGRRRIFLVGLVVFTLASLLAGLAWSEASLIAARAFQGLGAAIISPAALSILSTTFAEGRERNIALGVWGAVGGFGAAAGVLLGGVLTDALSWEWIFFVNVPVGVAAFVADAVPAHREPRRPRQDVRLPRRGARHRRARPRSSTRSRRPGTKGWLAGETIAFFAASLALLAGFVVWELRHPEPLMRFGILRTKTVTGANVPGFILGTAMFSMFLMLTLYMQQVLGYSAMKTGVAYLAVAGTAILWSAVAAQLVTRVGVKPVLVTGMSSLTAGLVYFTQVSVDGSYLGDLLPGFLLDRRRHRLLVRADLDRRARRRPGGRGGARVRADQHVAADRRRARHRRAVDDRDVAHRRRRRLRHRACRTRSWTASRRRSSPARSSPPSGIVAALTLIRRDELERAPEAVPALDLA